MSDTPPGPPSSDGDLPTDSGTDRPMSDRSASAPLTTGADETPKTLGPAEETDAAVVLPDEGIENPPRTMLGILLRVGPGLIIASAIVGSGELIATTAAGAKAGFWLLWLIIFGCVVKVFAQVEFGRYAISTGETTMIALAKVPGPRIAGGNWLLWYFVLVLLASFGQLGGIVGGVGQSLAISVPITPYGQVHNAWAEAETAAMIARRKWEKLTQPAIERPDRTSPSDPSREMEVDRLDPNRLIATGEEVIATAAAAAAARADMLETLRVGPARSQPGERSPEGESASDRLSPLVTSPERELEDEQIQARRWAEVTAELARNAQSTISEGGSTERTAAQVARTAGYLVDVVTLRNEMRASDTAAAQGRPAGGQPRRFPAERLVAVETFETERGLDQTSVAFYTAARRDLPQPDDHKIWATIVTLVTVVLLVWGRYTFIQWFSTVMVAMFTFMTVFNVVLLQSDPNWRIDWADLTTGPTGNILLSLGVALKAFGIIGVGATELVTYPYWCIEKGYARWTGRRSLGARSAADRQAWIDRARGWLRVMRVDAFGSMVIYTFATVAFYLLGASVLFPLGLAPDGPEMIRSLSVMYRPAFGPLAQGVFLFGAFAVLYSTFFVANASNARVTSDVIRVLGLGAMNDGSHRRRVVWLSGLFPLLCLVCYIAFPHPTTLVLISGLIQAIMLPMLAGAALYFRYRRTDRAIQPGRVWDVFLWLSAVALLITGISAIVLEFVPLS